MKRIGLGNMLPNIAAKARDMVAGSSRAEKAHTPQSAAWHDAFAPKRLMADFLAPEHAVLAGVPQARRDKILARAQSVIQMPVDEAMRQDLLHFMGNTEAGRDEREGKGMRSDVACWMMFRLLQSMAPSVPQGPREQAAFEHLLMAYRGYFASAVVNHCFHSKTEHRAEHADLQMRILASSLSPTQPAMLNSGYKGHTTLTRVGVLSDTANDKPPAGSLMEGYRQQVTRQLGADATPWLASHYQLDMTEALIRTPVIDGLVTSKHALVHPGNKPGMAQVTWRSQTAKMKTSEVGLSDVESFLQDKGLLAVANGLKATIHNGGSGARLGQLGTVRTYDQRLLIPLTKAQEVLSALQSAKLDDGPTAARALRAAAQYDGNAIASVAISPQMQRQALGNCTVHSQKLCLLYALQHLRELGDPDALNAREGAKLFTRIWTEGFQKVRSGLQDPQARQAAKQMGAEIQVEMAAMLAPKSPADAFKPPPARQPAPIARVRRPANYEVPAARPRGEPQAAPANAVVPPQAPHVLPPRATRPATPAALAAWGTESADGPPPADLLKWFDSVQGTAWTPASIPETKAFDRLVAHLKAQATNGRDSRGLDTWIRGETLSRRGHAASEQLAKSTAAPSPEMLEDFRNFMFAMGSDAKIAIQATPRGFLQALTKASQVDAFASYLRDRLHGTA